jgi:hypothetical protein
MSRRLIAAVAVAASGIAGVARADDPPPAPPPPVEPAPGAGDPAPPAVEPALPSDPAPATIPPTPAAVEPTPAGDGGGLSKLGSALSAGEDLGDQGIGATTGIAIGGRVTPGGLRFTGHYLYQLAEQDWFDGTASFTFGGGSAACFRDRVDTFVCDHGLADGAAIEIAAGVRRMFASQGAFRPFARVAVGVSYVRFSDDDVTGLVFPVHAGAGVRARVSPDVAIIALGEIALGFGRFGSGLGAEPQLGLAVTAGAEFRLQ